ncbi:MAG TPA: hypothetical protein VG225_00465 [Terracidiphilus sp.]|nr:hypothetical protein [Terracidiphilus sp.]
MGIAEIVKGRLKGMGYEAECTLLATRTEAQKSSGPEYSRCSVLQASSNLPDGYYEAVFCGHSAFLQRTSGC